MTFQTESFVADRARALAMVLLTRRDDLVVTERKDETGLDYDVYVRTDARAGVRSFGVLVKATMTPVTADQANKQLKSTMAKVGSTGPFMYPVCLFYFTARDDKGYYAWAYEPVVGKDGVPTLKHHAEARCHALGDESLARIIERVNEWYDAYYAKMVS